MAWGEGGEQLREQMKINLSKMRQNTYAPLRDMRSDANNLKHAEKQGQIVKELDTIEAAIVNIERTLNR